MSSFIRWYNARLAARPLLTQSVTTAFLFATGDVTAQQLVEKKGAQKHDLVRTGRMALYGGCESSLDPKLCPQTSIDS
jgi:protein Mpv17